MKKVFSLFLLSILFFLSWCSNFDSSLFVENNLTGLNELASFIEENNISYSYYPYFSPDVIRVEEQIGPNESKEKEIPINTLDVNMQNINDTLHQKMDDIGIESFIYFGETWYYGFQVWDYEKQLIYSEIKLKNIVELEYQLTYLTWNRYEEYFRD